VQLHAVAARDHHGRAISAKAVTVTHDSPTDQQVLTAVPITTLSLHHGGAHRPDLSAVPILVARPSREQRRALQTAAGADMWAAATPSRSKSPSRPRTGITPCSLSSEPITFGRRSAKDVAAAREPVSAQTIVKGVGTFTEPAFGDVTGTLTYTYSGTDYTYNNLVNVLKALNAAATPVVTWTYAASGNYTGPITGTINFTVVDIAFTVGGAPATVSNALTVKASPVYGDTWAAIVSKKANVTAAVGANTDADQSHFTLDVTGSPDAGSGQTYKLVYNGTIGGVNYANVTVCSGTVNVAQREAVISWANTTGRVYGDGKTVTAAITNMVGSDDVSITVTDGDKTAVGTYTATAALAGAKAANYKLPEVYTANYTINKATPTGAPKYTAITAADKTLAAAALTTTDGTFSVPGTVKWVDSNATRRLTRYDKGHGEHRL
jgi:hypothetical protein